MSKKTKIFIIAFIFMWCAVSLCPQNVFSAAGRQKPRVGIWVTVFSPEKPLQSAENADRLVSTCKKAGIDDIYLQVYRADKAYYDSSITDSSHYDAVLKRTKTDTVKYLIRQAHKAGIKVHAWINMLSIAQNENANILKNTGDAIITKDQYGRTSLRKGKPDELDKYYIREDQLFLEPGDWRVRGYLYSIAEEIVTKYPGFDGLHLDYIRYPSVVPFIPGARFTSHGLSYGYEDVNLDNFKERYKLDPRTMDFNRENAYLWDSWRRGQVTTLVKGVSEHVRALSPNIEISCTVVASLERTYSVTFQDWTRWLRERYATYIVVMNYTDDTRLMELNSRSCLMSGLDNKVHIGLGAYLLKDKPDVLKAQIKKLKEISPAGIVLFSYDDLAGNKELQNYLATTLGENVRVK